MKIITEVNVIDKIPTLLFYEEDASNLPLILVIHGFSNNKYEGSKIALKLAESGFAALCFDIDRHGSRYDGFMNLIDSDVAFGRELFKVIENTYFDIERLLDVLVHNQHTDTTKLGIIGLSIGANIANYSLGRLKNLKACVSLLGSPNFVDLLIYSMEKEGVEDFVTDEEKKLLSYVNSLDPRENILSSKINCPWLMINGSKDEDVPAKFALDFYNENKNKYMNEFASIIEDEFHYISNEMEEESINWMIKHILKL